MSIEIFCQECNAVNAFLDKQAGSTGKCGHCHKPVYIPHPDEMPSRATPRLARTTGRSWLPWVVAAAVVVPLALAGLGVGGYYFFILPKDDPSLYTLVAQPTAKETAKDSPKSSKDPFDLATAVSLTSSKFATEEGRLKQANGEAVFKFKAPATGFVVAYLDLEGAKLVGHLAAFDARRTQLTQNDPDADKRTSQIQFLVTGDEEHYVKVGGLQDGTGKFKLKLRHLTHQSGAFDTALELRLTTAGSATQSCKLDKVGDENMFRVVASVTGWMSAEMSTGSSGALDCLVTAFDDNQKSLSNGPYFAVTEGKAYYVKVASSQSDKNNTGSYTLSLRSEKDSAVNDFTAATPLALDQTGYAKVEGTIKSPVQPGLYAIKSNWTGKMQVQLLCPPSFAGTLFTYDGKKQAVGVNQAGRFINLDVTSGSTYYVKVAPQKNLSGGAQPIGDYTLQVATNPGPINPGNENTREVNLDASGAAKLSDQIAKPDDVIVFKLQPTQSGVMYVSLTYPVTSKLDAFATAYSDNMLNVASQEFVVTGGQTYFVKVAAYQPPLAGLQRTGAFDVAFSTTKLQQVDLDAAGAGKVSGQIANPGDALFVKFKATQSGLMIVDWSRPSSSKLDAYINVYSDNMLNVGGKELVVTAGQSYFVKVASYQPPLAGLQRTGAFDLVFRTAKIQQVDLDGGGAGKVSGQIANPGDALFVKFKAKVSGLMIAELNRPSGSKLDANITAYSDNMLPLTFGSRDFVVTAGSTYLIKVVGQQFPLQGLQSTGSFDLALRMAPTQQVDLDAAGTGTISGQIAKAGDVMFIKIKAPQTGLMNLDVKRPAGSNLDALVTAYSAKMLPITFGSRDFVAMAGDTYYVKVAGHPFPLPGLQSAGSFDLAFGMVKTQQVDLDAAAAGKVSSQVVNPWDVLLFKMQPAQSGLMIVDLNRPSTSKLDAQVTIYSEQMQPIGNGLHSEVMVNAGKTYFVKVAGHQFPLKGLQSTGAFDLILRMTNTQKKDAGLKDNRQLNFDPSGSAKVSDMLTENDTGYASTNSPVKSIIGHPHKVFTVKLKKGDKVVIRLQSEDFDPVLVLEDAGKKVLAFNDDDPAENTLNSRIDFTAPDDGEFRLICVALGPPIRDKLTGAFQLTVHKAGSGADGAVQLQAKYTQGDKFYVQEKILSDGTTIVLGKKNTQKRTQDIIWSVVVKSVTADAIVLEKRIESWKAKTEGGLPGGHTGGLMEQATKDVVFIATMTRSGILTKFEGYDQVLKKATDLFGPAQAEMVKVDWPESFFSADLTFSFFVVPGKAVTKGDTWRKISFESFGGLGVMAYTDDFTYEGQGKDGHLFSSKGTMTLKAGAGDFNIGGGIKVLKVDFKKKELTKKIVFDADKGRLVFMESTTPLSVVATVEAQGQQLEMQLDSIETRTMRLHTSKPMP
jgi:hypothetical protein